MNRLSWSRWVGIIIKEFIQLKRDRLTFGMVIAIPVFQLLLFGFAINNDPKHLPTAVLTLDQSVYSRRLVAAMQASEYFDVQDTAKTEAQAQRLLQEGRVQFVVTIPTNFSKLLVRGEQPSVLIEADASDPAAVNNAVATLQVISSTALSRDLAGVLSARITRTPAVDLRVQRRYNPEGITSYNIVPGLLGTILVMTMALMTGLAITRERERGTFENLLSTPALPVEVITGKIVPYILIGLIQVTLILLAARFVFHVPMLGSLLLLYVCVSIFIAANLALGITFSSLARNQLQAMQMTFFYFLPSILLSGFMFPFRGMPDWAQHVGSLLPLTHFLVIVRGILLKGNGWMQIWPSLWPIVLFMVLVTTVAVRFYKRTLD